MIEIVITLIVVGLLMWLMDAYLPLDAGIKKIIHIVIIICVVLWLLNVFGVLGHGNIPVPQMHGN